MPIPVLPTRLGPIVGQRVCSPAAIRGTSGGPNAASASGGATAFASKSGSRSGRASPFTTESAVSFVNMKPFMIGESGDWAGACINLDQITLLYLNGYDFCQEEYHTQALEVRMSDGLRMQLNSADAGRLFSVLGLKFRGT
jgi:hypothetical protein